MKSKVNNRMVAHVWANYREGNQISEEYSNYMVGHSMSTGGPNAEYLFSYDTLIGQRCECFGQEFYLVSNTRYSPTTIRHQSFMHQAIPGCGPETVFDIGGKLGEQVFAADLDTGSGRRALANRLIDQHLDEAKAELDKAERCRTPEYRHWALQHYLNRLTRAEHIKTFFRSTRKIPEADQAVVQEVEELELCVEVHRKEREALRLEREAGQREVRQERFDQWLAGDNVRTYGLHVFPTALRIHGKRIETTQGAYISLSEAIGCYRRWKAGELREGASVGGFTFNGEAEGRVTIGCHNIDINEIERVLKQHAA